MSIVSPCGVAVGQLPLILLLILFLLSSPFSHRLLRSDNVPAALARSPWPPRPLWPRCKCPSARGCAVGAPLWGWPRPEPAPSARWEVWRERRGWEPGLRGALAVRRSFRAGAARRLLLGLIRGSAPSRLPECPGLGAAKSRGQCQ